MYVLQALVNKSVNMVKQLYYSQILRKTSKSICLSYTVYAVISEGRKFRGFRCKLVEREILILEKEAVA